MSLMWHSISHKLNLVNGRMNPDYDDEKFRADMLEEAKLFSTDDRVAQYRYFVEDQTRELVLSSSDRAYQAAVAELKTALRAFNVVGTTDRFADSLRLLCWKMKWKAPRTFGNARSTGAGTQRLPVEVEKIDHRRLLLDEALYREAQNRVEEDFRLLCAAAGSCAGVDDYLDSNAMTS